MSKTEQESNTESVSDNSQQILRDMKKMNELIRHIRLVQDAAKIIGEYMIEHGDFEFGRSLIANSFIHDQSKFRGLEWDAIGSRDHECSEETLNIAINQHNRTNPHHPEYWQNITSMPEVYIAEMVCDFYARSVEFGTDLRQWISEKATEKYGFTKNQKIWKSIKKYVDILLEKPF